VTLPATAPAGGAVSALQSGNNDVVKVPSSVTVAAGQKTATFTVDTSTVPANTQVTLQAVYQNITKLFILTVRAPALNAKFSVTSASKGTNACSVINTSGLTDCVFDASGSTGFVAQYLWTLKVGSTETKFTVGKDSAIYTPPTVCADLQGGGTLDSNGAIVLTATLVLEDRGGARSGSQTTAVSLFPLNRCGY
jgi:hypothetical protein